MRLVQIERTWDNKKKMWFNVLLKDKIFDWSKLKAFEADILYVAHVMISVCNKVETTQSRILTTLRKRP